MSLVRNHIDLEKDHLWVVYPRTREGEKDLHIQIVGVWEPETLKRHETDSEDEPSELAQTVPDESLADPGWKPGHFSIRGEIVFHAPDEQYVVVKIQQAPRKSSQKAKAFKLSLKGVIDNPKTVGYFWDLHVEAQNGVLVITKATCIGLAPPKKKQPGMPDQGRPRRPMGARGAGGASRGGRPSGSVSPRPSVRREPISKPVKRSDQSSED